MRAKRKSAAILISGSGTNLQSFIDKTGTGELDLDIAVVLSNKLGVAGLERARKAHIPIECVEHGEYLDRESFDAAVNDTLDRYSPDL
ncbi:MAG: formyltransferase family protein, partial [Woeseiaceae bacterium]|nr:formyltransferase family protein [Woeseiaceae bacterium]